MPGGLRFSRNMTVIRQGNELVLVNSMRLSDDGLAELERLGKVAHVVRLAGFHGRDDLFYKERYGARVSCIRGQAYSRGFGRPKPADIYFHADAELDATTAPPVEGARLFVFDSNPSEALLLWERDGGTVISGDALQNWASSDEWFSWLATVVMRFMGFIKPHNIGPGWLKQATPPVGDLERLLSLSFDKLLPAHGSPVLSQAAALFRPAIERAIAQRRAAK